MCPSVTEWEQGAGADEVPVLPHVFVDDPEKCTAPTGLCGAAHGDFSDDPCLRCIRCRQYVRPSEVNNRCPARAGQSRGFVQ